jgi:hypothetical protein
LTDRPQPPATSANRVARASRKKRRPLAVFAVPVVLVVLGAGLLLFLGGGTDAIPIIGNVAGPDDTVPPFDFKEKKSVGVGTTAGFDKDAAAAQAAQVGTDITPLIDDLFTNAFLDPTNWRAGDYEEILDAFSESARMSAQQQLEAITLGATAGDVFETVQPDKGSLEYRVLFDEDGTPGTAVVKYRFYALGERKDGTYLAIVSHGQLFLQDEGGWRITAFRFLRNDVETEPPVATGATGASGASGAGGSSGASGGTGSS